MGASDPRAVDGGPSSWRGRRRVTATPTGAAGGSRPLLAAFLRRHAADGHDLDDLRQETLITVHRARHTYDPSRPLEPWLFAIARSVAIDHHRRQARRRAREIAVETCPRSPRRISPAPSEQLAEALAALPAAQREAFELLQVEGCRASRPRARRHHPRRAQGARAPRLPGAARLLRDE